MKNLILFLFCLFITQNAFATWTNLNTGINDNLTGIAFQGNYGVVSGEHGLYYTSTGGMGASAWTRFDIQNNPSDASIYNNTRFTHCDTHYDGSTFKVFACGKDTVANKGVIFQFSPVTQTYNLVYYGYVGSGLNDFDYNPHVGTSSNYSYIAVGEDGLILGFDANSSAILDSTLSYNLNAIDIAKGQNTIWIATVGAMIYANYYTSNGTFLINEYTTNSIFEDVFVVDHNTGYAVGEHYYERDGNPNITLQDNYYADPLNGRVIFSDTSYYVYVGTDDGIYTSIDLGTWANDLTTLERFPSTIGMAINGLCKDNVFYACGDNGVVLRYDAFEYTKPYIEFAIYTNGCVGSNVSLALSNNGTSLGNLLYLNDSLIGYIDANSPHSHTFDTVGLQTLKVVNLRNNLPVDSAFYQFNVVDTPDVNLNYLATNTTICQEGRIDITIDSAEANTTYTLHKPTQWLITRGSASTGTTMVPSLSFQSNVLSDTGPYMLRATSDIMPCAAWFPDSIIVDVDKTIARVHSGKINTEVNQDVHFYEQCTDAQYYTWYFDGGATDSISNLADPINAFSQTGRHNIKLVCWNDNGCYDSTTVLGPMVYTPPAVHDSF